MQSYRTTVSGTSSNKLSVLSFIFYQLFQGTVEALVSWLALLVELISTGGPNLSGFDAFSPSRKQTHYINKDKQLSCFEKVRNFEIYVCTFSHYFKLKLWWVEVTMKCATKKSGSCCVEYYFLEKIRYSYPSPNP